ncbi:MAG: hypothetical protein ACRDRT_14570 [Pseudonocardiaceae bacterium]
MTHSQSRTDVAESLSAPLGGAGARDLFAAEDGPVGHGVWRRMQRGLVYPAPHALFATFWRAEGGTAKPITKAVLSRVLKALRAMIHERCGSANTTAVVGVGFRLWRRWCAQDGVPPPTGMRLLFPSGEVGADGTDASSAVFHLSHGTFIDSQADLWFHIKSDQEDHCLAVFEYLSQLLAGEACVDPHRPPRSFQRKNNDLLRLRRPGGRLRWLGGWV